MMFNVDKFLEKHDRKLVIYDGGSPYLTRYYLAYKDKVDGERTDIPFNVFYHIFHKSDSPIYHSHPFSYTTIILKGGYFEHRPNSFGVDTKTWYGPGSIIKRNRNLYNIIVGRPDGGIHRFPSNAHWIEIPEGTETHTLFIRGKKFNNHLNLDDWYFYPNIYEDGIWWKDWIQQNNGSRNPL